MNDTTESQKLSNAKGIVGKATNFAKKINLEEVDIVTAIGVIQYLTSEKEFGEFVNNCSKIIKKGGSLVLKHPLSTSESYVLDYERIEMETRYVAKYYNLSDIMDFLRDDFELISIERTFTRKNLGKDLENVERDSRARQMWIHLIKK